MRKSIDRRIYESTLNYQKRFPERTLNQKPVGRVSVRHRAKHIALISKILIKDSKLRKIFLNTKLSDSQNTRIAARYLLTRFNGNPKLAKKYAQTLNKKLSSIQKKLKSGYMSKENLSKIAEQKGFTGDKINQFIMETQHLTNTPMFILSLWLTNIPKMIDLEVKKQKTI